MINLILKTKSWVNKIYSNADHLIRTAYWVKKLDRDADEALIIAALTHDIERAFEKDRKPPSAEYGGAKWNDRVYNLWHSERSAKFTADWLTSRGATPKLIKKISSLIALHEVGGNKEANHLQDADSISFLEINTPLFISWVPHKLSKKEVKEKLDFMFNRITGKEAKKIAKRFYDTAIQRLEEIK